MHAPRKFSVMALAALAVAALAPVGSAAPTKGTWTFTDASPDPTVVADTNAGAHCSGDLPSAPGDVNIQKFKAPKAGTLKLIAHNALDWAVEVRRGGVTVAGTDGANPDDPENLTVSVFRGKYEVVYCNFSGEPSIEVDYSFK
ncbi:MAG: hypothetical protein QOH26_896 [Actinomycetota bacterium]|nr:hypothetical protein [Actinomycetota bacterium]